MRRHDAQDQGLNQLLLSRNAHTDTLDYLYTASTLPSPPLGGVFMSTAFRFDIPLDSDDDGCEGDGVNLQPEPSDAVLTC